MSIRDDLLAVRDSLTATLDGCNAVLAVPAPDISCLPANIDETKTISEEAGFQRGYGLGVAEGEQNGFDTGAQFGKQLAQDEFWDRYQNNGAPSSYLYAFAGPRWNDKVYNPQYPIVIDTNALRMYSYSNITDTKVEIDASLLTNNTGYMFESSQLVTIRKLKWRGSNSITTTFASCTKLKNIVFEGEIGENADFQWCPLSHASIENIVSVLSATATGKTLSLKKSAVEAAFTTEEWETLAASKPNWTITLV